MLCILTIVQTTYSSHMFSSFGERLAGIIWMYIVTLPVAVSLGSGHRVSGLWQFLATCFRSNLNVFSTVPRCEERVRRRFLLQELLTTSLRRRHALHTRTAFRSLTLPLALLTVQSFFSATYPLRYQRTSQSGSALDASMIDTRVPACCRNVYP